MNKLDLRIALVSLQKDAERVPPVGLVHLATFLRERVGIPKENIVIFDSNFQENIIENILKFKPHLIGVSAMTVTYQNAISFATCLKKVLNVPIILGGVHISTLPNSFKKCFDVGVIGEGEKTLQEIIESYLKNNQLKETELKKIKSIIYFNKDEIKFTGSRNPINLDSLPIPDFKFVSPRYFEKVEIPAIGSTGIKGYIMSSRGCPYRCVFCSTSRFWGKLRFHSAEYTAREAKKQIDELNVDYLQVLDDLFSVSPKRLQDLKKAFEKEGILDKIQGLDSTARANLMNDELCEAMKAIKIKTVNFGFESGSDRVINYLKAGSVSVENNKKAVLLAKRHGFTVYGSLMYGSPGETIQDMKKTNEFIDFCAKNGASNIWSFVATPFPATPFWDIALKRGTVSENMNFNLLSHHNYERPLLLDKNISKEDFDKVFWEGKRKLRNLRLRLILKFILKNPLGVLTKVLSEPSYWIQRLSKQLLKQ